MASNAKIGKLILIVAVSIFLYYFFWVSVLPFMLIDEGNPIHGFFPSLEYAFVLPAAFGIIFVGGIASFSLYHMWTFAKSNIDKIAPDKKLSNYENTTAKASARRCAQEQRERLQQQTAVGNARRAAKQQSRTDTTDTTDGKMPQWLVIGISGVTCGGKTTLAHSIRDYFHSQRNLSRLWQTPYSIGDVQLISQDDYFLPVDDLRHKWNDRLNAINFELLTSLDMKQMLSDITWTMQGRYLASDPMDNIDYINEVCMFTNFEHYAATYAPPPSAATAPNLHTYPIGHHHQYRQPYHVQLQQRHLFTTHQQQQQQIMRVNAQLALPAHDKKINILIIEGFMIFNQPELLTLCNIKFHLHLPYEKCYQRRCKRTYEPPDVTGYFEVCVWPHYEKNFAEFRDRKDIIFLNGELSRTRIFNFVLQKIIAYFEERCDISACPPPLKLLGIPSCSAVGFGSVCVSVGRNNNSNSNNSTIGSSNRSNSIKIPKPCPMEQQ